MPIALAGCSGSQTKAQQLGEQADALLQAGNIGYARYTIDAAIRERDDIAALQILKGRIAVAQGDRESAFNAYSNAMSLDATNMEAMQGVTQLGLAIGRWDQADAAADKILIIIPGEPSAVFAKGLIALSQRRIDDALKFADTILTTNPRDARGLILKARALYARERIDDALATLDKGTAGGTLEDPIIATYLELHRRKRDAAAMLKDMVALERMRPREARIRLDLANLRYKTGDTAGARDGLLRLIERRDLTAASMMRIVAIWQQYDRDPIAKDALASAAFGTDRARVETARYYLDTGRPAEAMTILGPVASEDAKALAARIQLLSGTATPETTATIDAILAKDETQCDALAARATMKLQRGAARDAVVDAQHAAAECPANSAGHRTLIAVRRAMGDRMAEFRAYDAALSAMPWDVLIAQDYYDRAKALGDSTKALSVARQVTRALPSWPGGWMMQARACAAVGDTACRQDAERRADEAKTVYRLDPLPGEAPARGLDGSMQK
ncbi:tetratricopeptide repeat protein [Sphingomonas floccifaciens]|uniref:Tetratricopeptide repeat protein n=1 Tax=Sphingomonas floccifaciens TaxID=1844115 RepID=A0ABW4N9J0_9SPHN